MIMAMIRPETEMKDSGVQWLGNIPKEWSIGKVKHEFYATKTIVGDKVNDYERLALTLNGVIKRSKDAGDGLQPEKFDGYQILKEHELVFKLIDLANVSTSRVGLSPYTGIVSPAYIVLHHRKDMNPRYGEYYFLSMWMNEVFNHIGGDGVRSALNAKDLLDIPYLKVSPDEQQLIADYLDETCPQIDEIIAEAKASIDEYKELKQAVIDKAVLHGLSNGMMKNSENDLIGKIPLSWEMRKLKYVADFNPSITVAYDVQKEVGYVPMNCVKNGYMNPLSARLFDMSTGLTGFQNGDIVIAKVTPCFENGNIAIAENLEQGVAFGSSELFVIRTHSINRRFMLYYLQNSVFKNQCISTMTGTGGLKRVSGYFVNNAYITYPPENEQQVIVDYLDETVKNMDSLIDEKESLINDLEAYKKSLIYEVVTGKRRVV